MKRLILSLTLLFLAAPLFAVRTVVVVDEVIRMSKAGVGDDEIIAYVRKNPEPFDVTGDDVIAMTDAHVSRAVVKAVIDESAERMRSERREPARESQVSVYAPRVYAGWYDPWYSPYYYDPFWYGPRVSLGFAFGGFRGGFRGGHGHHFRHR